MKKVILFIVFFFLFSYSPVFADSSYVLPYPSFMPGGVFYKLHLAVEKLHQYWYFGSFGQFTYNLEESDKYLVEAKTLFEYRQYLLGYKALEKSNHYFRNAPKYLRYAEQEGKDISEKSPLLKQASLKHKEVLEKMGQDTPKTFVWKAEKSHPVFLDLRELIQKSISIRSACL